MSAESVRPPEEYGLRSSRTRGKTGRGGGVSLSKSKLKRGQSTENVLPPEEYAKKTNTNTTGGGGGAHHHHDAAVAAAIAGGWGNETTTWDGNSRTSISSTITSGGSGENQSAWALSSQGTQGKSRDKEEHPQKQQDELGMPGRGPFGWAANLSRQRDPRQPNWRDRTRNHINPGLLLLELQRRP